MKDDLTKEQSDNILQALDNALEKGPWQETNFLRAIGKKLQGIRDNYAGYLQQANEKKSEETSKHASVRAVQKDEREVFMVLYSSSGANLVAWERLLANLPAQMISRPIYGNEKEAQAIIKTKTTPINEAYVSIIVKENDVLPVHADKQSEDKLGTKLLSLKDNSLKVANIRQFIHSSGVYWYHRGHLIKKNSADKA